jgi:hypothetical protein
MIAGVVLFGKAIGKTHREIMKLYDTLRLWDVSEMAIKCDEFLSKRGKVLKKKTVFKYPENIPHQDLC